MESAIQKRPSMHLGARDFQYVADLKWFDGPLLSLFWEEDTQTPFLLHWVDVSADFHQWVLYPVSKSNLRKYLDGKISHRELFFAQKSELVMLLELNGDFETGRVAEISHEQLEPDFIPSGEEFFDPFLCPDAEEIGHFLTKYETSPGAIQLGADAAQADYASPAKPSPSPAATKGKK